MNSNGYSNSYSSFSTFPSRSKYKSPSQHLFTDASSSYTFNSEAGKKACDINLFQEYDNLVRTEIRLINKVCEDKDLTELILNLNKYKKFYRNNINTKYSAHEEAKGYNRKPLYPKHNKEGEIETDIIDEIIKLEKQKNQYKEKWEELTKKTQIMEKIHKQMKNNLISMEKQKQKLEAELESEPKLNTQSQSKLLLINYFHI